MVRAGHRQQQPPGRRIGLGPRTRDPAAYAGTGRGSVAGGRRTRVFVRDQARVRGLPGAKTAATAATATAAAPVSSAGPIAPSYPIGEIWPPFPRKTAVSSAMPKATPNSRTVELDELAIAKSSSGRPWRTAVALGAKVSPMPTPAIASGTMNEVYGEPCSASHANHTSDEVCRVSPTRSSERTPVRLTRAPAIGATTIGAAVQGSVRMPASSGL